MYRVLIAVAFALATVLPARAANTAVLKVYDGYNFARQTVTESGSPDADVSFYVNRGRRNAYLFELGALRAGKIKEFGANKPENNAFAGSASWKDAVNAPSPGWYAVVGKDGTPYRVRVIAFKNQGKAAAFWELSFTWEKLR